MSLIENLSCALYSIRMMCVRLSMRAQKRVGGLLLEVESVEGEGERKVVGVDKILRYIHISIYSRV